MKKWIYYKIIIVSLISFVSQYGGIGYAQTGPYQGVVPPRESIIIEKPKPINESTEKNPIVTQELNTTESFSSEPLRADQTSTTTSIKERIKKPLTQENLSSQEERASNKSITHVANTGFIQDNFIDENDTQKLEIRESEIQELKNIDTIKHQDISPEMINIWMSRQTSTGEIPAAIWMAMDKKDRIKVRSIQKNLTGEKTAMIAKVIAPISTVNQAMNNSEGIVLNSMLALLYLLVFFYCTQLINELRDRIKDDRGLGTNRLQDSFDRLQQYFMIRILTVSIGLVILGVLMSFIDTSYLAINSASVWLTIFLLGTLVLGALAKDIALYLIVLLRSGRGVNLNISVAGYLPVLISVFLNRAFSLTPNVLFGSVIKVKSHTLDDTFVNSPAHRTWSLLLVMATSSGLRFVSDYFVGGWYVFFIGLAYGLCVDVFWALTRIDAFWGSDVYRYNKWIRYILYFSVLFAFLHLVFNPAGDFDQVQSALNNDFWSMIWVLVGLIIVSGVFWVYVYYLHPFMFKKTP